MDLIARKQEEPKKSILDPALIASNNRYELFESKIELDVDGVERTMPRSIGFYSLNELNAERARLESMIAIVDVKITAVQSQIDSEK